MAELDRWGDALMRAKRNPAEAGALRKQLPAHWRVDFEGEQFIVPTTWLHAALETIATNPQSAPSCEVIQKRLRAVRAEALRLREVSTTSPTAARSKLDRILKHKEFRGVRGPTWWDTLIERVALWLSDVLERLFGTIGVSAQTKRRLVWVFVALSGLMLAVWMIRRLLRRQTPLKLGPVLGHPATRGWQERTREALAAAGRGNFRDAIRLAYWAGVYRLEEIGLWKTDRTRTHREYLGLLPSSHPQRDAFAEITRRFELVWYAGRDSSLTDFEALLRNLEKLGCVFPSKPETARS